MKIVSPQFHSNRFMRVVPVIIILVLIHSIGRTETNQDYKIGPSDLLRILVWETPTLDIEMPVRPDGKISFPLVGDMVASGSTPSQLQELIARKLSDFIKEPQVSVMVLQINSFSVYIQGAVAKPGEYKLDKKTNIIELLSKAEGFSIDADLRRAYMLRGNKRQDVDFHTLVESGDISQNVELMPRDFIFIPRKKVAGIVVSGEILKPQVVDYREVMRVLDAIDVAGGFTNYANRGHIKVIR